MGSNQSRVKTTMADCLLSSLSNSSFMDTFYSINSALNEVILDEFEVEKIYKFLETENYSVNRLRQMFGATDELYLGRYSLSELLFAKCMTACKTDDIIDAMSNNISLGFMDLMMLSQSAGGIHKKSIVSKDLLFEDDEFISSVLGKYLKDGVSDKFKLATLTDFLNAVNSNISFNIGKLVSDKCDSLKFSSDILRSRIDVESYVTCYGIMRKTGASKEQAFMQVLRYLSDNQYTFNKLKHDCIWFEDYLGYAGFISMADIYEVYCYYNAVPVKLVNGNLYHVYGKEVSSEDKRLFSLRDYDLGALYNAFNATIRCYCGLDGKGRARGDEKFGAVIYDSFSDKDIVTFSYWFRRKYSGVNLRLIEQKDNTNTVVLRLVVETTGFLAQQGWGLQGTTTVQCHSYDNRLMNMIYSRNFSVKDVLKKKDCDEEESTYEI